MSDVVPLRRAPRSDLTDEALLGACARGDNLALQELFERHADRVYGVLVRTRYIDTKDLEDLVQTTFIEVQRSAKRFDNRASVTTWIIGIALNVMRQYLRSERRRRVAIAAAAETPRPSDGKDLHDQVAHRQELARVQRRFEELPAKLRVVFTLIDLEGMSGVEVAKALNLPEGTVWSRLHEAREQLRRSIGEGAGP